MPPVPGRNESFTLFFSFFLFFILSIVNTPFVFASAFEPDIFRCVDKGDMGQVTTYLAGGGNPNHVDAKKRSLLARAAYRGHEDIAKMLLQAGASVDLEDDNSITPLYQACSAGHAGIVCLFIPKSRDINHGDARGVTALHIASKKGQTAVVQELCLSPALQINKQTNEEKETALWLACCQGHLLTVEVLLQTGDVEVDRPDRHGVTPLLISSYYGYAGVVRLLLAKKAKVNQVRDNGISPLIIASYQGHEEIVRIVIDAGADVMYRSPETLGGGTAYHYALQQEHPGISQYLQTLTREHLTRKKQQDLERSLQELQALRSSLYEVTAHVRALEEKEDQQASALDDVKRQQQQHRAEKTTVQQLKDQLDKMQVQDHHQRQKLKEMETLYAAMLQDHQQRVRIEEEKRALRSDDQLRIFYEKVERTLNQLFLAYKVLDTGMVERTKNSRLDKASQGINLLGEMVPLPFASLVTSAISFGVSRAADRSAEKHIRFIAQLIRNTATIDQEAEEAARALTKAYEEQIKTLTPSGVETLAQCGIGRLIDYIQAGQLHDEKGLSPHFIQAVAVFSSHQGRFGLKHRQLETSPPKKPHWTDKGVFQKTGIITEAGIKYIKPGCQEYHHYGFRKGTPIDAEQLGYTRLFS
jgi:ankyrin repeat protein